MFVECQIVISDPDARMQMQYWLTLKIRCRTNLFPVIPAFPRSPHHLLFCILLRYTLHPTELHCILLSFNTSFLWATLQRLSYTAPSELAPPYTSLLNYAGPPEQCCTLTKPRGTLGKYAEHYWATLYLLSCTLHYWATVYQLHPLWASSTILSYATPYWAPQHPVSCAAP